MSSAQNPSALARDAAYDPLGLHVLAYAHGFTLWHYLGDVPLERVAKPGFFNPARGLLRAGDRIAVNSHHGGRFAAARDYCVATVARPEVMLVPLSPIVWSPRNAGGTEADRFSSAVSPAYA